MIYASEAMDRFSLDVAEAYYSSIATPHKHLVDTLVLLTQPDPDRLDKLAGELKTA
jgi:hypothetical protein